MKTGIRSTVALVFAGLPCRASATGARKKTIGILESTAHLRARLDQLAICGHADTPSWGVAGEGGGSRNDTVSHKSQEKAIFTLEKPGRISVSEGHAEGGFGRQIARIETQETTIAQSPFLGVQFGDQGRPAPAPPTHEHPTQADADRVERRRSECAAETLSEDGPPGGKVKDPQHQVIRMYPSALSRPIRSSAEWMSSGGSHW